MIYKRTFGFLGLVALGLSSQVAAQTCQATDERHAVSIESRQADVSSNPVVYGKMRFTQTLENGWTFALVPSEYGWNVQVLDKPVDTPGSVDMSAITPPFGSIPPNSRDIAGWHFRNADNTRPNTGDINAPQQLRVFMFDEALIGTGGFRPPQGSSGLQQEPPNDAGRGWLLIKEYGLTDLQEGQKARMVYMEFSACLTWPKSEEERREERDAASASYISEELEFFALCGLDLETYAMDARLLPRQLSGDFDGDGAGDEIAQITRRSDGRVGFAVCRASTWLDLIGIDQPVSTPAVTDYVPVTEAWMMVPAGAQPNELGFPDSLTWPATDGDAIILQRFEKQAVAVFWKDGQFHTKELFHLVTE